VQEAVGAEPHNDFVHKIRIGRKEVLKSRYRLHLINKAILKKDTEVITLRDKVEQLARILYAISHPKKSD
jgi:four helix bundle protein